MSISFALQPQGNLAIFNGPTGYFLAFNLDEETAIQTGIAHGMSEDDARSELQSALHDKVFADIDQPFGTRRWNELICSIEKDRGESIAKLALTASGNSDYVTPDKIRARFNLPTETEPALGRTTPNNVLPLYLLKADDEMGMIHYRDEMSARCSFKRDGKGGFELWRLNENKEPISKFDIEGMEIEIMLPLRGDSKIKYEFEQWFAETYPNAVDAAPGLR
jgi:hypothetical protein